jgi:hypothetical protein
MYASSVNVDPDGDVLAILLKPPQPFAPWGSDKVLPNTGGKADDTALSPGDGDAAGNEGVISGCR